MWKKSKYYIGHTANEMWKNKEKVDQLTHYKLNL